MRILLDECIDESLRFHFAGHDCQTCRYAKLAGLRNGRLLRAAEDAGFEVVVTIDRGMPHQQNLADRSISLLVLTGRSSPARWPSSQNGWGQGPKNCRLKFER